MKIPDRRKTRTIAAMREDRELVILTAMEAEARPIIERLGLEQGRPPASPLPFRAFEVDRVALVTPGRDERWGGWTTSARRRRRC